MGRRMIIGTNADSSISPMMINARMSSTVWMLGRLTDVNVLRRKDEKGVE